MEIFPDDMTLAIDLEEPAPRRFVDEGVAIRHGQWKFYDPSTGMINKIQTYTMGKLENPKSNTVSDSTTNVSKTMLKPKEVQDYEKKNAGKKKIKVRDGQTN